MAAVISNQSEVIGIFGQLIRNQEKKLVQIGPKTWPKILAQIGLYSLGPRPLFINEWDRFISNFWMWKRERTSVSSRLSGSISATATANKADWNFIFLSKIYFFLFLLIEVPLELLFIKQSIKVLEDLPPLLRDRDILRGPLKFEIANLQLDFTNIFQLKAINGCFHAQFQD